MRKKLIIIACMLLAFPSTTFANQCANTIINKTKNNLGSASGFTNNVCRPHLALLARHPVRRHWTKMSASEQEQQMKYACGVFYTVAGKLAKLNPTKIKWVGNVGIFEKKKIVL